MQSHALVALVTLAALLVYLWMGIQVPRHRRKCGIAAPAMTGDPVLERTIRAHYNTLEWLPVFLAALWLFALYGNDRVAAALGVAWCIGRIVYQVGYVAEAKKRLTGFLIQALATFALIIGAAIGAIQVLSVTGV